DIAEVLGYKEKSRSVKQCIDAEEFEKGIDYDLLHGKEIRELINARCGRHLGSKKFINNLTIFYKEGLLGFINYAHMPIGKEFRKWLRTEVFSEIIEMKLGKNIAESTFEIKRDNLSKKKRSNTINISC
ncbi:MAG: BRO family protein, partial [Sarcina sp.]